MACELIKELGSNIHIDESICNGIYCGLYHFKWRFKMQTARIFENGRSQAVRLPKEFRFSGKDVYIKKIGNMVVLLPKDDPWAPLINSLNQFTDDFMQSREQPPQDQREPL
jgi:antitoxin VapB